MLIASRVFVIYSIHITFVSSVEDPVSCACLLY